MDLQCAAGSCLLIHIQLNIPDLFDHPSLFWHDGCWYTDCGRVRRDVVNYYRVRPDLGVVPNHDATEDLRPGPYVYVAAKTREARLGTTDPYRDLLKNEAIRTDLRFRMNDYTVRMREQQTPADSDIKGDVGSGNDTPETVLEHPVGFEPTEWSTFDL